VPCGSRRQAVGFDEDLKYKFGIRRKEINANEIFCSLN